MRIAITGGSGRVGRGVIELALARGYEVISIDRVAPAALRPDARFIQADITQYDQFKAALAGCQGLIHLAAIPSPGNHPDHEVHNNNVVGSYNALCAAVDLGISKVCQASSINAVGAAYSRWPRFDYLPLDEAHPTYNEDPYSLSKWICEQQGDSIARRYEGMTIGSLRFHWVTDQRPVIREYHWFSPEALARNLWSYTLLDAAARACLAVLSAGYQGHEAFFIAAPRTMMEEPSLALKERYFPTAALKGDLSGHSGFYNCAKAGRLLNWRHDEEPL